MSRAKKKTNPINVSASPLVTDHRWRLEMFWVRFFEENGKRLGVFMANPGFQAWIVTALEIDTDTQTEQGMLDNHAHELVGKFPTEEEAKKAADAYGAKWKRRRKLELCKCEAIQ